MGEFGIKESKEFFVFLAKVGNVAGYALSGRSITELLPQLIDAAQSAMPGLSGLGEVDDEIFDYDDAEKDEVLAAVKATLDIPQDEAEATAEDIFHAGILLIRAGGRFRKEA